MDNTVKKTIAAIVIVIVVAIAIYGTYLPMRKAQLFIATLQSLQAQPASSLTDLESKLSGPLDYPSPIGQEELVRNMANSVLSFVQRGTDATSTGALIDFLNTYYDPIVARGRGMSFGQDLYLLGAINEVAFAHTGDPRYLEAARNSYSKAHELGPNRPQPLYGLFDIYRAMGDVADTKMIAGEILKNWPTDPVVGPALAQFLASAEQSPTSSRPKSK
jgi:hypothetical protein